MNPSIFEKGTGDQALYRYVNPNLNVKKFKSILVDPVIIYKDGELDAKERQNYQILANNAYAYLTGKQSGVGEITMEMTITDADTGELLGATLDQRVGGRQLKELWSSWHNADDALQYWARRLRFVLCDMRGRLDCVNP